MKQAAAAILAVILLSGCGAHRHSWAEADCLSPRTCVRCGAAEGAPLGHDWAEATCLLPRTCGRCGAAEGEALGHSPLPADYWTPSLCALCGAELGSVATPDFERYGLRCGMETGVEYDYLTACLDDPSRSTLGKASVSSYEIGTGFADYEAVPGTVWQLLPVDGCEWRVLRATLRFDDENAWQYGALPAFCCEDYYDIRFHDDHVGPESEDGSARFAVAYRGESYECLRRSASVWLGWDDSGSTLAFCQAVLVPAGYDGVVFGLRDQRVPWEAGQYIWDVADENTLFFRMDG